MPSKFTLKSGRHIMSPCGLLFRKCTCANGTAANNTYATLPAALQVAINGERPWMDPECPEPLRKLITKCWHQDPHMRPSPADIMRLTEFLIQEELRKWELPP